MDAEYNPLIYPERLSYSMARRRGKLIKYRRMMKTLQCLSVLTGGGCALALLFSWPAVIALWLGGGAMCFTSFYAGIERKYNKIRAVTIKELGRGMKVCRCAGPCACREDFLRDMDETYDINLSY